MWLPAKSVAKMSSRSPATGGPVGVSTTVPSAWVSMTLSTLEKTRIVSVLADAEAAGTSASAAVRATVRNG